MQYASNAQELCRRLRPWMLTHEHDARILLQETGHQHAAVACGVRSLPEGPTFVLMRNRTQRFSSGQNTFLY